MRTAGFWWGAVLVMAYGATAAAAPKNAGAPVGAAGAAGAASSSAPVGPAPSSVPANPANPANPASDAPLAPDAITPTPDATTPPPAPPLADDSTAGTDEEAEEKAPPRKKRKRHRNRPIDDEDEDDDDDEARVRDRDEGDDEQGRARRDEPLPPPVQSWRLVGPHFLLGVERITNVLGWSITQSQELTNSNNNFGAPATTLELERSGTDVSFLASGATTSNVFATPRVALDGMFDNGFTIGGSLSYMVVSGEHEVVAEGGKATRDDGTSTVFIFAPRIGVVIPASPLVGIWLRGGVSRISLSNEVHLPDGLTGGQLASTVTSTLTLVNFTLDPQLVINPVPHVGITLGALIDIGVSGSLETTGVGAAQDVKASSYGVTSGLVAIF